jgi:hypothetical protein
MVLQYRNGDEERLLRCRRECIKQMKKHKLMVGKDPWQFEWSYAKTQLGHCDPNDKAIRLSKYWMLSIRWGECLDTILHEIAHAIVGCENGHNSIWQKTCIKIGAKPNRLYEGQFVKKRKELNYTYPDMLRYRISS